MGNFLIVGIGGFLGSISRYGLYRLTASLESNLKWPLPTFTVNLLGSFLIGLLAVRFMRGAMTERMMLLTVTGFCGGFTTFSAFSMDSIRLMRDGHYAAAVFYILTSVVLCLAGTWAGVCFAGKA